MITTEYQPYIFPLDEAITTPPSLVCIDDRYLKELPDNEQIKLGGGAYGFAQDVVAASIVQSGGELPTSHRTIDVYAKMIGKTLRHSGILPGLHTECAAEGASIKIAQDIVQESNKLWGIAQELYPDMTESSFEQGVDAYRDMLLTRMLRPAHEAAACMERDGEYPALHRHELIEKPHASDTIIASHTKHTRFNTKAAFEAGAPAYFINFGEIPVLAEAVQPLVPVQTETVLAMSALRHASIAINLPHPNDTPEQKAAFDIQLAA